MNDDIETLQSRLTLYQDVIKNHQEKLLPRVDELLKKLKSTEEALFIALTEVRRSHDEQLKINKELLKIQERHCHWGPSKVPDSLEKLYLEDSPAGRDFRLIIEDRRVTDLSADYHMKRGKSLQLEVNK